MKRYYYRTSDGESHGPSVLDFPVREVRYGALSPELRVERAERRESIVSALDNSSDLKPFERPDVGRISRRESGESCYIAGSVPDA